MPDFLEFNEDATPLINAIDRIAESIDKLNRISDSDKTTKLFNVIEKTVQRTLNEAIKKTEEYSNAWSDANKNITSELQKLNDYYKVLEKASNKAFQNAIKSAVEYSDILSSYGIKGINSVINKQTELGRVVENLQKRRNQQIQTSLHEEVEERKRLEANNESIFVARLNREAEISDRKHKEINAEWIAEEERKNKERLSKETAAQKQLTAHMTLEAKKRMSKIKEENKNALDSQIQDAKAAAAKYLAVEESKEKRQLALIEADIKAKQRLAKEEARIARERERAAKTWTARIFGLNAALADHERSIEKVITSWGFFARLLLVQLAHRAVAEVVYALKEAVKTAAELNIRIGELQSISLDSFAKDAEWLEGLAALSSAFGMDIQDQTEAAYQALSNQIANGTDAIDFLREANQLAITAVMSTTDAVELLTGALNAYGQSADKATEFAGSFFKMIELGRLRGEEMADSFGDVAILAKQLNIDIHALQASLAAMSIQGIKYNKAATQMRGIMVKLLKPTKEMKQLFHELGVTSGEEAVKVYGWIDLLNKFQEHTKGSSSEMAELFSRIRGLSGALAFTGEGFEIVKRYYAEIQAAGESYSEAFENSMDKAARTLMKDVQELKNLFIVEWGQPFIENLAEMSKEVGGLSNRFKTLITSIGDGFNGILQVIKYTGPSLILLTPALKSITAGTWAWVTSLTAAQLALGGIAAAFIIGELAVQAINAEVDRWERRQEEIADAYLRNVEKLRKAELDRIQDISNSYTSVGRKIIKTAAEYIGQINALSEKYAEEAEAALKNADKTAKKTTSLLNKYVTALERNISKIDRNIDKLKDKLDNLAKDFENREFNWRLADADTNIEKINLIRQQLLKLGAAYRAATAAGNKQIAIDYLEEGIKLQEKLRSLQVDSNKDIKKALENLKEENKEYAKEKQELEEKYKEKAKDNYKELKEQEKELNELRKKYRQAETNEERKRIRDELNELREERKETLSERQKLIKEYGKEKAELTGKYKEEVSEQQKKIQEAGGQQGQDIGTTEDRITQMMQVLHNKMLEFAKEEHNKKLEYEQKLYAFRLRLEQRTEATAAIKEAQKVDYESMPVDEIRKAYTALVSNYQKYSKAIQEVSQTAGVDVTEETNQYRIAFEKIKMTMIEAVRADQLQEVQARVDEQNKQIEKIMGRVLTKEQQNNIITNAQQYFTVMKQAFDTIDKVSPSGKDFAKDIFGLTDKEAKKFEELKELISTMDYSNESILKLISAWETFDFSKIDVTKIGANLGEFDQDIARDFIASIAKFQSSIEQTSRALVQSDYMIELKKLVDDNRTVEVFNDQWEAVAKTDKVIGFIIEKLKKEIELENELGRIRANASDRNPRGVAHGGKMYYASGEMVRGTDTVPAVLTPGEFVMNRRATLANLPKLIEMNRKGMGFANGGSVVNVGDIHVNINSSGNNTIDGIAIANSLKRTLRRKVVTL